MAPRRSPRTILRPVTALVVGLAVLQALTIAPARAHSPCFEEGAEAPTLVVTVDAAQDVYRVGDTALVHVLVERDLGDRTQPAEGAHVFVALKVKKKRLYGGASTAADGRALVRIDLEESTPAGLVDARAVASKAYGDNHCLGFREEGAGDHDNLFLLRRAR